MSPVPASPPVASGPAPHPAPQPAHFPAAPPPDLLAAPRQLFTPRLRLEAPDAGRHAAAFAEGVAASMHTLAYVAWGLRPRSVDWARRFCEDDARSMAAGQDLSFHVFRQDSSAWVGRIDVHTIDLAAARGEMGYVGDARQAGQGLMREAALAVIDLCFALGFERIEAMSDARNARALHFAATLGMAREGVLRRHERDVHGALCDMVLFAVLNPHGLPDDGGRSAGLASHGADVLTG